MVKEYNLEHEYTERILNYLFVLLLLFVVGCVSQQPQVVPSDQKDFCLNSWASSKPLSVSAEETFRVEVSLDTIDKKGEGIIDSLPFGYNGRSFYLCEKERPLADICFITGILTGPQFAQSTWIPEFELNNEQYIKSLTIECTCYYDPKLNMLSKYNRADAATGVRYTIK